MAFINMKDLIGKLFDMHEYGDKISKITLVDAIKNQEEDTHQNLIHTKFRIKFNKDKYEEIITYNELMDHLNNLEDGAVMWELQHIISYQRPVDKNYPNYMESPYNVNVKL